MWEELEKISEQMVVIKRTGQDKALTYDTIIDANTLTSWATSLLSFNSLNLFLKVKAKFKLLKYYVP